MGKMYHWFSKLFFNWLIRGLVASNVLYIQTLPYLQKWIYRLEYRGRKSCLLYPQVFIRFSKNCYWNFGQAFNQWNLARFLNLYTFLRGYPAALGTSRWIHRENTNCITKIMVDSFKENYVYELRWKILVKIE